MSQSYTEFFQENGKKPTSPIYKKGSKSYAANYRPISLTCILSKLLESFVKGKVLNHLLGKMLLSKKQYGFISVRSTTTQLLKFLDKCMVTVVNDSVVDTIYFDFKKSLRHGTPPEAAGKVRSLRC